MVDFLNKQMPKKWYKSALASHQIKNLSKFALCLLINK